MAEKRIGLVLALDGEKKFTQALQSAKKETNLYKTELKNLSQEFSGNANSMDALKAKQETLAKQQDAYQRKLNAAKTGLDNAKKAYNQQSDALEDLKKRLEEAKKAQQKMEDAGDTTSDAYRNQCKQVDELSDAVDKQGTNVLKASGRVTDWNKNILESERELRKVNKALDQNEQYLKEAESATDHCATSIDNMGNEVKSAEKQLEELGDEVKDTADDFEDASKGTSTFKQMLAANLTGTAIVNGLKAVGGAAIDAAKYAVEVGSSFEAAMSEVAAVSGASGSELDAMTEKAKELGSSTKFSATEAADAFKYMSLAGWSTSDMLSGIDGIMNLAAASGMELAAASDMVTDYLSAFGMQAGDSAYMADMLASAQASSNTTAEQLGEAYKNCAANLNASGQDIETTTSLLEAMANQGLKGSEAGTALTAMMRDITAKMKDGKIAIGDTSVAVMDANGNYRDLTDILSDVEVATEGMGDAEKNTALQSTFTSDSIKGLNLVLADGMKNVSGYEEALRNSEGAAKNMADTMNDNLKGDLTTMNSALEGLGIAAYDYVEGPVRGVVQGVTGIISGITEVIAPQKSAVDELVSSIKEANDELKISLQNADITMQNAGLEAWEIATLGEQLISLNTVENKSLAQKYQLKEVVSQLGKYIPEITTAYDEQAGSVNLTDTAIRKLIGSTKELIMAQAAQNAAQEIASQLLEADIALKNAETTKNVAAEKKAMYEEEQQLLKDLQNEYNQYIQAYSNVTNEDDFAKIESSMTNAEEAQRRYFEFWENQVKSGKASMEEYHKQVDNFDASHIDDQLIKNQNTLSEWSSALQDATNDTEELSTAYEEAEDQMNIYSDAAKDAADKLGISQEELEKGAKDATDALDDETGAMSDNAEAASKTAEEIQAAADSIIKSTEASTETQKEATKSILDAYHGYVDEIKSDLQDKINPFEKFDTADSGEDFTVEEMTKNLESQNEAFERYAERLAAVKERVGKEISPEFMKYLESMGMEGDNTLKHILATLDETPGEFSDKVKAFNDEYLRSLDLTEGIAEVGAANRIAYEAAMGELGSTDEDFSELRYSINAAVSSVAEGWNNLPEATETALEQTVQVAQACGIKIPDGLAEGIASGEILPQEAISQLKGSIEGTFEGLSEMAKEAGIEVPPELAAGVKAGGQEAVDAISQLVQQIAGKSPELQKAIEEGTKTDGVKSNVESSVKPGADAITEAAPTYRDKSKALGEAIAKGIEEGSKQIQESVRNALKPGADAIAEQKESYVQAGASLGESVSEGLQQSLESDSGSVILNPDSISNKESDYQAAGRTLGEAVVSGLQEQQNNINDALSPDAESITGKAGDYQAAGEQLGIALAEGLASKANDAQNSGTGYDGDTLLYNLETQVKGLALWEQQLEELGQKGVTGALMEELQSLGPDAAANIWSLNQMTKEQLDQYVKLWEQKSALANSQAIKENEPLRNETNEQIAQLKKDAEKELSELNKTYKESIKQTTESISTELSALISKAGKIGEDAVAGLVKGIKKQSDSVDTYKHTNAAVSTLSDGLETLVPQGELIGKNTLDGLLAGLQDEDKIKKASVKVVNSIKRAMENEAEIHSPSRLFKRAIGLQMGAGVGTGLKESAETLEDTSRDVIRNTLAAAQKELASQQASLSADMAMLDTSGITALNNALTAYQPAAPIVNVDNSSVAGMMQQFMTGMQTMVKIISGMGVYINEDVLVGQIQPALSRESAAVTIRRNRGRR